MDRTTEVNLLYDFYAGLLTDKQREVIRLYYCENLSLSEISDDFAISRHGVYDTLKNAEKALAEYEEKLGFARKHVIVLNLLKDSDELIESLTRENAGNGGLIDKLLDLRKNIYELGL